MKQIDLEKYNLASSSEAYKFIGEMDHKYIRDVVEFQGPYAYRYFLNRKDDKEPVAVWQINLTLGPHFDRFFILKELPQ